MKRYTSRLVGGLFHQRQITALDWEEVRLPKIYLG